MFAPAWSASLNAVSAGRYRCSEKYVCPITYSRLALIVSGGGKLLARVGLPPGLTPKELEAGWGRLSRVEAASLVAVRSVGRSADAGRLSREDEASSVAMARSALSRATASPRMI